MILWHLCTINRPLETKQPFFFFFFLFWPFQVKQQQKTRARDWSELQVRKISSRSDFSYFLIDVSIFGSSHEIQLEAVCHRRCGFQGHASNGSVWFCGFWRWDANDYGCEILIRRKSPTTTMDDRWRCRWSWEIWISRWSALVEEAAGSLTKKKYINYLSENIGDQSSRKNCCYFIIILIYLFFALFCTFFWVHAIFPKKFSQILSLKLSHFFFSWLALFETCRKIWPVPEYCCFIDTRTDSSWCRDSCSSFSTMVPFCRCVL